MDKLLKEKLDKLNNLIETKQNIDEEFLDVDKLNEAICDTIGEFTNEEIIKIDDGDIDISNYEYDLGFYINDEREMRLNNGEIKDE